MTQSAPSHELIMALNGVLGVGPVSQGFCELSEMQTNIVGERTQEI